MSTSTNLFYRTRESEARQAAEAATLDNVRDRHLEAAKAWAALAVRGEKTDKRRAETEARKAAEHEAARTAAEATDPASRSAL